MNQPQPDQPRKVKKELPFLSRKEGMNNTFWVIALGCFIGIVGIARIGEAFGDEEHDKIIHGLLVGIGIAIFGSLIAYLGWFFRKWIIKKWQREEQELFFVSPIDYSQNLRELPKNDVIRAIMLDMAIPVSILSLIGWGIINLAMWLLGHQTTIEQLARIPAPSGTFDIYIYGGCVAGVTMLMFGIIGQLTKSPLVGYLDGIALVGVGIWNICCDIGFANNLENYGYHILGWQGANLGGYTVWRVVGIIQFFWGISQIYRYWRFGFLPKGLNKTVKIDSLKKLQEIIQGPASHDAGRFKINIRTDLFAPGITGGIYTVWLLPDKAFCLHDQLRDYFECDRRNLLKQQLAKGGKEITINGSAFTEFKEWLRTEN